MVFLRIISFYLFVAVLITSFLLSITYSKGKRGDLKSFFMLSLSLDIYMLGYLMELNSKNISDMIFWNQIQYIGIPFFPAFWLLACLTYAKYRISFKNIFFIMIIPFMTFFIRLTNQFHNFYYKELSVRAFDGIDLLYIEKGPWYYVQSAYIIFAIFLSSLLIWRVYVKRTFEDKKRLEIVFVGTSIPYLGLLLLMQKFWNTGIDWMALFLPVSLFIISYAFLKYDFLEIKTFARENIFENSSYGIILLSNDDKIVDYNIKGKDYGRIIEIIKLTSDKKKNFKIDKIILKSLSENKKIKLDVLHNGEKIFFELEFRNLTGDNDILMGKVIYIKDITQFELLNLKLQILANIDELSDLKNRRAYIKESLDLYKFAFENNMNYSVTMIDIDFFKKVNDSFGHACGDYVIKEFGHLMKKYFDGNEIYGRLGGEEFAITICNEDSNYIYKRVDDFRKIIENYNFNFKNNSFKISISIGIAFNEDFVYSFEELLNYSDKLLYEVKNSGRNKTYIKEMKF